MVCIDTIDVRFFLNREVHGDVKAESDLILFCDVAGLDLLFGEHVFLIRAKLVNFSL